jgi:hypothetical protein
MRQRIGIGLVGFGWIGQAPRGSGARERVSPVAEVSA